MEQKDNKIITFRFATIEQLMEVVDIERMIDDSKLEEWLNYKYEINKDEKYFLNELIDTHRNLLHTYNEISLTAKFIAPVLNKVKFYNKKIKDWYGYKIEGKLNGYTFKGEPDYIIATGISYPKKPYFFLQEYKRAINPTGNPEYQVVAEMLIAMTLNNTNIIRGSYIVGRTWNFLVLEKLENEKYKYYVSKAYDCLDFEHLKQIYINLQAVKLLYCK